MKLVIPRADLCIGFAGGVDVADAALTSMMPHWSDDEVRAHLLDAHLSSEQGTDFMIAHSGGRLFVVRGGTCEAVPAAWIGDYGAFAAVQADIMEMERFPEYKPPDAYGRARHAFDGVVTSAEHDSVGDFTFEAFDGNDSRFRFRSRAETYVERLPPLPPDGGPVELDWGDAAIGSFSMTTYSARIRGDSLGRQIAVTYFDMSQVGWVYWSDTGGVHYPRVFRGLRDVFFPRCQEEFGLIIGD